LDVVSLAGDLHETGNFTDCHDSNIMLIKKFALDLKPYMYPFAIEFSITCATIFLIMWFKIGNKNVKKYVLLPLCKNLEGVGKIKNTIQSNTIIMLDCTKTSKGLFFGIIVIVGTLLSAILFIIFNGNPNTSMSAKIMSEITEISLLIIALVLTIYAYYLVRKNYTKIIPAETNIFDIVLEIFSLFGVYAYSVNSLIALFYSFSTNSNKIAELEYYMDYLNHWDSSRVTDDHSTEHSSSNEIFADITACLVAVLSLVQGTFQTVLILECLRRYAVYDSPLMHKPARELITALLLTNVALWVFDSLSAKRFAAKPFLVEHFGILKWSIINAFSAPIAIFYRFHSSVCLSDIWHGLYYGENDQEESNDEDDEYDFDSSDLTSETSSSNNVN
jgi:hypothetical protein